MFIKYFSAFIYLFSVYSGVFSSRLNISLVQISSILEGLGLVVLVVDQLSPNWDLAPVPGCFCLLLLQDFISLSHTLTQADTIVVTPGKVHANA